jgi:hypothetical protein
MWVLKICCNIYYVTKVCYRYVLKGFGSSVYIPSMYIVFVSECMLGSSVMSCPCPLLCV